MHDGRERSRIEARTAHQHSVYFRLRHQALHIVRFHASTVENPDLVSRFLAVARPRLAADHAMRRASHFGRSDLAGADGPHRLVGDHDLRELARIESGNAVLALLAQYGFSL